MIIIKTKNRYKLPNGFGSIIFRDVNRRKPWQVRKTIDGRQRVIGYYATYDEALGFLVAYNKDPSIFSPSTITFSEVFNLMASERFVSLAPATVANYKAAYKYCSPLYEKRFVDITISDLQSVIHKMSMNKIGYASQKKCRQVFHHMFNYAIKYRIIEPCNNVSAYVDIDKKKLVYKKTPFNIRQLNRVKAIIETSGELAEWAMCVVMMCYSGVRPSEFLAVTRTDVKLKQRYFIVRDSKTEAGRNRAVPISKKTLSYFEHWLAKNNKTLIADKNGHKLSYHRFRIFFDKVMAAARCKHTPHECRHTCATMLDNVNANDTAIKRILGHSVQGITKGVYTHKDIHQLKRAIDLMR